MSSAPGTRKKGTCGGDPVLPAGLSIDSRQEDRIGVVRPTGHSRWHIADGDLHRAEELLEEAEQELRGVNDQMERALLLAERGRFALAEGRHKEARDSSPQAGPRHLPVRSNSPVQAATCQRLLALVAAVTGRRHLRVAATGRGS